MLNVKGRWLLHLWSYNAVFWPVQRVFSHVSQSNRQNNSLETGLGEEDCLLIFFFSFKKKEIEGKKQNSQILLASGNF